MAYKCLHCSRNFATPSALKRHISAKHQYESEDAATQSNIPNEEPGLWDETGLWDEPGLWDDEDFIMNYSEVIS